MELFDVADTPAMVVAMTHEDFIKFRNRTAGALPFAGPYHAFTVHGAKLPMPNWWTYTPGGYGCLMSHVRIFEKALTYGLPVVAVFEHDAILCEDFAEQLHAVMRDVPEDWHQLYLGGQHIKPYTVIKGRVVRGTDVNRTHAYVMNADGMCVAYKHIMERLGEGRRGGQVDYLFGELHQSGALRAYCAKPWLCGQHPGKSTTHPKRTFNRDMWWNS